MPDDPNIEHPGEMSEAEVDQTIADSFPASDPPSWTTGTDHTSSDADAE